jgi:Concanavalin A-like lectin/glucanases superfamily
MSSINGPAGITNSLVLALDAANVKSYPGSGTTWYDVSGFNNHATVENGTPTWGNTGSYANGSFNLNSANFRTANSFGGLSTFTIDAWFQPTSFPNNSGCVVSDYYPSYVNYKIGYDGGSSMSGGIYNAGWYYSPSISPALNTWCNATFTWTGNSGTASIYQNGTLTGTSNLAVAGASSNSGIRIGRRWDIADYFLGYVATVKIYSRALSFTEIAQLFNATRKRFGV